MATKASVFLNAIYEIVQDPDTNHLVHWEQSPTSGADCFVVVDPTRLAREVFPRYFRHANWGSAQRQLHMYGFQKVSNPNEYIYYHPSFKPGRPDLLASIKRRPPSGDKSDKVATPAVASGQEDMLQQLMQRIELLQDAQDVANERIEQMAAENKRLVEVLVMHEESQAAMEQAIQVLVMKYMETFARQKATRRAKAAPKTAFATSNPRKRKYLAADLQREPGMPFWTSPTIKKLAAAPVNTRPTLASCIASYAPTVGPVRQTPMVQPLREPAPVVSLCTEFAEAMDLADAPSSPAHVVPSSPAPVDDAQDMVAIDAWLKEILEPSSAPAAVANLPTPLANMELPTSFAAVECTVDAVPVDVSAFMFDHSAEHARTKSRARLRAARESGEEDDEEDAAGAAEEVEEEKMVSYVRSVLLRMDAVRQERVILLREVVKRSGLLDGYSDVARAASAAEEAADHARTQGLLFDQALDNFVMAY